MTSISQSVFIDKLYGIVKGSSNTYHRTIKMKPVDVKSSIYIDFNVEKKIKDPKSEVDEDIRKSKHKNIFAKKLHSKLVWGFFD